MCFLPPLTLLLSFSLHFLFVASHGADRLVVMDGVVWGDQKFEWKRSHYSTIIFARYVLSEIVKLNFSARRSFNLDESLTVYCLHRTMFRGIFPAICSKRGAIKGWLLEMRCGPNERTAQSNTNLCQRLGDRVRGPLRNFEPRRLQKFLGFDV
jgi:hypothetical protein